MDGLRSKRREHVSEPEGQFSHLDRSGRVRMVDVSKKRSTRRRADARCTVFTSADLFDGGNDASSLTSVHAARLAGIMAAKQTASLIPLCHPINLHDVQISVTPSVNGVEVNATVVTVHRTGVEMEALTACAVAAISLVTSLLEIYPFARMDGLVITRKSGGKSADWGLQA
jgi:cyclic pyranopterin phosphate synthase